MNDLFASLYENGPVGFYDSNFSQEIFSQYLYQKYGLILFFSIFIFLGLYYKLMDKPRFAKIHYWFLVIIIVVVFNFSFLYIDAKTLFESQGFDFDGEYTSLAIVNSIYALLLFVLLSFGFKFISVNNSKIPF
ncbi:hypothetical protein [Sphingobacterium hungaricum]|uniref:Uncharacterized protein n=1 Tax=Sphingobacterium hungaricum TaxID=2082723 RepID=A0A928UWA2_9SPHI|nr:hypothetical protein [Sphingobacterium hungaricum]MBE8712686.1 hypothetical protein [Sphingobacterium hungaricum]